MHGVLVELAQPPAGAHVSAEKGIDHIVARVADLDVAAARWEHVLGLKLVNRIDTPNSVSVQVPSGQVMQ